MSDDLALGQSSRRLILTSVMRIRREVGRIRRLHSQLGDERDLPVEVDEALHVLVAWAATVAAQQEPPATLPKVPPEPPPVEPGPLAARPRPRHPMRRTAR